MSFGKSILIRLTATVILSARRKATRRDVTRWVVITGSVGKTMTRTYLAHALRGCNVRVASLATDYVNELGVVCTFFGLPRFRWYSLSDWRCVLFDAPPHSDYALIELGADFRLDIDWFLSFFQPYAVIYTTGTGCDWTGKVAQVLTSRARLVSAVSPGGCVIVSADDVVHRALVARVSVPVVVIPSEMTIRESVQLFPRRACDAFFLYEGLSMKPNSAASFAFPAGRLTYEQRGKNFLIADFYKSTPVCLRAFLYMLLETSTHKRIVVISEVRPRMRSYECLLSEIVPCLTRVDEVYVVGDKHFYTFLSQYRHVQFVPSEGYGELAQTLSQEFTQEGSVALGIKVSKRYAHTLLPERFSL